MHIMLQISFHTDLTLIIIIHIMHPMLTILRGHMINILPSMWTLYVIFVEKIVNFEWPLTPKKNLVPKFFWISQYSRDRKTLVLKIYIPIPVDIYIQHYALH